MNLLDLMTRKSDFKLNNFQYLIMNEKYVNSAKSFGKTLYVVIRKNWLG